MVNEGMFYVASGVEINELLGTQISVGVVGAHETLIPGELGRFEGMRIVTSPYKEFPSPDIRKPDKARPWYRKMEKRR